MTVTATLRAEEEDEGRRVCCHTQQWDNSQPKQSLATAEEVNTTNTEPHLSTFPSDDARIECPVFSQKRQCPSGEEERISLSQRHLREQPAALWWERELHPPEDGGLRGQW